MSSHSLLDAALTENDRALILQIARRGLEAAVQGAAQPLPPSELTDLPQTLLEPGACFVTLYSKGELRGCTGTLLARQTLAEEIFESAIQTALRDPRFEPVTKDDLPEITIAVAVLSTPQELDYRSPSELVARLRPGVDGVTLSYGIQRGTFLPQVWEKISDPVDFLSRLCAKMGLPKTTWMSTRMKVEIYQAIEISETDHENA